MNISIKRRVFDWLKPILILVSGFAIAGILIFASGKDPFVAYKSATSVLFSSIFKISDIFTYTTVLMIIGAGLVVAFTGNIWNVGAEGQLWIGALLATFVVFSLKGIPSAVLIPVLYIVSFVGGALWAAFPGWLKARYGTNEVLTSMLMCPIAYYVVVYFLWGVLKDPVSGYAQGQLIPEAAFLPILIKGTRLNIGLFVSLAVTLFVWVLIEKSVVGYRIKMIGASPKTAQLGGIRLASMQVWTMVISGGICGMAGAQLLMGVTHRLLEGLSPGTGFWGYGFMGIAVVVMAKTKALVVIATAILFSFLISVTYLLEASAGVSHFIFLFIQGIIILLIVWMYK